MQKQPGALALHHYWRGGIGAHHPDRPPSGFDPRVPYRFHLAVDGLVGIAFVVAPIALGFSGLGVWYYMVLGLTVLAVAGMHQPDEREATA